MNKIIAGTYARITPYGERRKEASAGQEDKKTSGRTGRQEDIRQDWKTRRLPLVKEQTKARQRNLVA